MAVTIVSLLIICSSSLATGSQEAHNSIRLVTDTLPDLENSLFGLLDYTSNALPFIRFARRYGKRYESAEDVKLRFRIFSKNLDLIRATNKKKLPYTLEINQFADWSWGEFKRHKLGAAQNCSATGRGSHRIRGRILPEMKDWREDGIVSPVKDQGHCGSCWTFSTTGALEAAYNQAFGKAISLSEQQLVDCANAFNNFGCNGGLPSQAFEYVKYNGGLDTEEAYPYIGKNGSCHFLSKNVGVQVIDSVNITLGDEKELKDAVAWVRPVSVAFEVVDDFRFYKDGIYMSNSCGSSPDDVNHAVLAVGYGVDHGVPYWIIKNSWGVRWGDKGYFKMEMGKNMCGVATCASYPIVA